MFLVGSSFSTGTDRAHTLQNPTTSSPPIFIAAEFASRVKKLPVLQVVWRLCSPSTGAGKNRNPNLERGITYRAVSLITKTAGVKTREVDPDNVMHEHLHQLKSASGIQQSK